MLDADVRAIGGRTLEIFANTPRLNAWMYSKFSSHVRGRVLEVGSGIGNLSALLLADCTSLVVSDVDDSHLDELEKRFGDVARVSVLRFDLGEALPRSLEPGSFETIVAVNVIEHVSDDLAAVQQLRSLLTPGGTLCCYVPAAPWAFGTLDVELGHYRRYDRPSLERLLSTAGFEPGPITYMNLLGLPGWYLNGRVLRRRQLSSRQVALFERLVPLVRLEDRLRLPLGMGLVCSATRV